MSQRQCLPLDDSSDSEQELKFDLTNMDSTTYLKQVRNERKKIPQIVTVHPMRFSQPSSDQQKPSPEAPKEFNPNTPTPQWRELQRERFAEIQQKVVEMRKDPAVEERLSKLDHLNTSHERRCIAFCQQHEPVLSVILALNQGQLEELIEIFSDFLSENIATLEFHQQISSFNWATKWIYASLACLRTPLDPEVHNCLRMIAKSCVQVTNHLKTLPHTSSDSFLPWHLITVVIAINFHQFDLLSL